MQTIEITVLSLLQGIAEDACFPPDIVCNQAGALENLALSETPEPFSHQERSQRVDL